MASTIWVVGAVAALTVGVGVNAAAPPTPRVAVAKEPAAKPAEAGADGLTVRVLADGKPVAGATVFNRDDGEREMETASDATGRCGNVAGGKAVIAEAAKLAESLPTEGMNGYYRGFAATYLAPFDLPRAEKLLTAHRKPNDYNRYFAQAIDKDRPRAWKLIDTALALLDQEQDGRFSWSNSGGRAAIAARVALAARKVGHPDSAAGVAIALSRRPAGQPHGSPQDRERQMVQASIALSLVDPAAARRVLAGVAPPEEFARRTATTGDRNWLFAVAFVLPEKAPAVIDQRLKHFLARKTGRGGISDSGLIELSSILTAENRYQTLAGYASLPRVSDDWGE
jgi:hypothetical protein